MVLSTMADSSEREELEGLIEDWNASRLDMFTISKPDANLEFCGNMRFYFQEPGAKDTKVSTKVLRVSSSDTTDKVMSLLVSKFHPDMKMLTMPKYTLYEVHETGAEAHKLELDQRPLYVQLYWQREDRDGRFLLKSEDDQMTQTLFGAEESARNPGKPRNSKPRQSKKYGKNKKKASQTEEKPKNISAALYDDQPNSSFTRTKSNPEIVMKIQRKKKLEDKLKKLQDPETSGGGGGPLRIFAESLQPENPYKTILCASNDTTETVLKDALQKYEVPAEEMDQYCLTMVTIAPGSHSDPESSSGIKERVVPDHDCPAAIAASWPENSGELRFYLKKKENMPKRKQLQPRKKRDEPHARNSGRPGPTVGENSPPATKETTFDVTEHSPTEKEPSSPAVHIVDAARDLPATLEFRESGEDAFFAVVVSEVNGSAVNFKLAPTFTLYMCCRYRLSPKFRPDFPPNKRREKVMTTAKKVANMMWQTVKENSGMAGPLAFWMANSSEFLHFLKQDVELSGMTEESQKILAHTTQQAFRSLVQCIKAELQGCLPAFLDPSDENDLDEHGESSIDDEKFHTIDGYQSTERSFKVRQFGSHGQPLGGDQWMGKRKKTSRPVVGDVLHTLNAAMALLRRCRVNPALTIQLFSQVFHFINMWLFNRIVLEPQLRLCTRSWGARLRERLERLQAWAENQGLELAAECHLARISQAALLLQIPKQDSTAISSHCYKLNSLQLRQLLELYQPERDEPAISLELIEKAVSVAESTADEIARSEGQQVLLEEEPELHLPFLLPDDGYSSEKIRGVPPGLKEFLDPLITPGLCRLTIQPKASGLWTVHFKVPVGLESPPPEVIKISINKGNKGMGVSIVAAKGVGQERSGIYVKEVIDGGPAALDGRLSPGDQIMDVNGESLVGIQQEDAVKILLKAGSVVNMTVAKKAVYNHGLVQLLSSVAPVQPVQKVDGHNRTAENRNLSPLPQKKEVPRAPPRYRPPQDSPQRSPPLNTSVQSEVDQKPVKPEQKPVKPEPHRRRSPYERSAYESPEQSPVQTKTVVEYKLDEPPPARKPPIGVKPLPYANPQEIQRRQKEIQQRKVEEQEKENIERERREQERMDREEAERSERIKSEERARQERERMEREQQERQRIEREQQERQRIERERQERDRMEREQQERQRIEQERLRREREEQERKRREREEAERKRREDWEREKIEREESERRRQEERKKQQQERLEREQREKEEYAKRMQQENSGLDEMTRRERELEMMLEQKRREKENRLKELQRQIQEEREESERMEQELMERLRREREERPQRMARPSGGSTVHYVNDKGHQNEKSELIRNDDMRSSRPVRAPTPANENRNDPLLDPRRPPLPNEDIRGNFGGPVDENRSEELRPNRPMDYNIRVPAPGEENRNTPPLARRPPPPSDDNRVQYSPGKRPTLQNSKDDSFDIDPAEVERQFQHRLAQEAAGKSEVDGVRVIRVPVQQNNWESHGIDTDDRPRVRVDRQREEEDRNRKEQQWRREQDEQLVRDFQQNESLRQQPAGAVAEPVHSNNADWEKDEELRRQRDEDDRLREARANQLRNRIIERPEDDEELRDTSYANGRTRRVKFASVRTEIIQPSPDAELTKHGHSVKFVHDGKVEDSDDDEFPMPPPPADDEGAPPPSQDQVDYYQRPPPPPKPQNIISNGGGNQMGNNPPHIRDNEHIARARVTLSDEGYATYPGPRRQQHNNNYPVPKPRGGVSTDFTKSPSPDNAKLPFKDKMKVFNENTPPQRYTTSKWEQRWANGDSL